MGSAERVSELQIFPSEDKLMVPEDYYSEGPWQTFPLYDRESCYLNTEYEDLLEPAVHHLDDRP